MKNQKNSTLSKHLAKPSAPAYYGTAGYRLKTHDLNNVLCRASLIAYIRSATFVGKYIGLYITASHNPAEYNGIKFIDFNGNMLEELWENYSDELVNCEDADFNTTINKIFRHTSNYSNMNDSIRGNVIIGRDTRESGVSLYNNIKEVLTTYKCNVLSYDEVTCPEMHYLIRRTNEMNEMVPKDDYIKHLTDLFYKLTPSMQLGVDTANGVGLLRVQDFNTVGDYKLEVLNDGGVLNKDCGADYIKVNQRVPSFPKLSSKKIELAGAFDGDVDRLILFTNDGKIFDGDAQCVFIAEVIKNEISRLNAKVELGVVLSHYSNMGAVDYLRSNGFTVVLAQTGVKNFSKAAKEFDIGVYFEPNGHGSVIFSKRVLELINNPDSLLYILSRMFDPCVGDALANMLIFTGLLSSVGDLIKYKENFTRLMTVKIANKNIIKVDQNNVVMEPDIQRKIDETVLMFKGSRAFVRPSGTEDLVRVFAEAPGEMQCDKLALNVAQIVYDNCHGIGPHPEITYDH